MRAHPRVATLTSMSALASSPAPLRLGAAAVQILADGEATAGAYALLEVTAPGGARAPRRVHRREDLGVQVLEGVVEFEIDGRRRLGRPGTHVLLARGVPHAATVRSPSARVLVVCTPAGVERLVRALADEAGGPPPEGDDLDALLAMAGVQALGAPITR